MSAERRRWRKLPGAPLEPGLERPRRWLTSLLTLMVWYALIAGHLLNNLKGVGF